MNCVSGPRRSRSGSFASAANFRTHQEAKLIGNQVFRSGTSIGANYRAACRGRSRADFISKLGIVLEETDETVYWLEILAETGIVSAELLAPLAKECRELLAIFVASLNTAKS